MGTRSMSDAVLPLGEICGAATDALLFQHGGRNGRTSTQGMDMHAVLLADQPMQDLLHQVTALPGDALGKATPADGYLPTCPPPASAPAGGSPVCATIQTIRVCTHAAPLRARSRPCQPVSQARRVASLSTTWLSLPASGETRSRDLLLAIHVFSSHTDVTQRFLPRSFFHFTPVGGDGRAHNIVPGARRRPWFSTNQSHCLPLQHKGLPGPSG
jgi:hypothetical protein